eukprot:4457986-Prymnesium_polylepis.2
MGSVMMTPGFGWRHESIASSPRAGGRRPHLAAGAAVHASIFGCGRSRCASRAASPRAGPLADVPRLRGALNAGVAIPTCPAAVSPPRGASQFCEWHHRSEGALALNRAKKIRQRLKSSGSRRRRGHQSGTVRQCGNAK